jgi:hypothetical protein
MSNYFKRLAARSKINLAGDRQAAAGSRISAAMPAAGSAGSGIDSGSDIEVHEEVLRAADAPSLATENQASSANVRAAAKPASEPAAGTADLQQISASASRKNDTSAVGDAGYHMASRATEVENISSDSGVPSSTPVEGRSRDIDNSITGSSTQSSVSATTSKVVIEPPRDEAAIQPDFARKNTEDRVESTLASGQALSPGHHSSTIVASTASDAMQAGITEKPRSIDEREPDPAASEPVGAYLEQAASRVKVVDIGPGGTTSPSEIRPDSVASSPVGGNAKPENRIEIKIGKVDLEIHQPVAAARPPAPQPRARDTAASAANTGNRLSRYYLRGGPV